MTSIDRLFESEIISGIYNSIARKYYSHSIVNDTKLDSVHDRVYISDLRSAVDSELLASHKITHIISALPDYCIHTNDNTITRISIPILDTPSFDILGVFNTSNTRIKNILDESSNNRILVHCMAGASRSVSLVAAFLIEKYTLHPTDVLTFIKFRRPETAPNIGFIKSLEKFYSMIKK